MDLPGMRVWMMEAVMKHVFGPVRSRRLGRSLGIDPLPVKTCNWNCVYCQLGRTRPLTNERRTFVACDGLLAETEQTLADLSQGTIDWITLVGSGEPTLYEDIGPLIAGLKRLSGLPVAVITNGSLLHQVDVRRALLEADAVLPSLDVGSPALYRRINRPHPSIPFDLHVEGLRTFRTEYGGPMWLEVMLLKDLNDSEEALQDVAGHVADIRPDEIHLMRPTRPPAESWVEPADDAGMLRAFDLLGRVAPVRLPSSLGPLLLGNDTTPEGILSVLARHPMPEPELRVWLDGLAPGRTEEMMTDLLAGGCVQVVERYGESYWSVAEATYAPEGTRDPVGRPMRAKRPGRDRLNTSDVRTNEP